MKYKLWTLFFIIVLTISVASCKSKQGNQDASSASEKPVTVGEQEGVPEFYLNPPLSDEIFYGVGTAKMKQLSASKKAAIARARDDIAFQVQAQVQSAVSDYYQESGEGDNTQAITFYESVSKQIADTTLEGSIPEKVFAGPDGTLYALVSFPRENVLQAAQDVFARNESAAFAEFKADEALKRLDEQIKNSPTQAGQGQ